MKILHYMPVPSKRYNKAFINMIKDNDNLEKDEHIFWILSFDSYLASKDMKNVCFKNGRWVKDLKAISETLDVIVIHGFDFKLGNLLSIPESIRKKMVWVVWGHDLYRIKDLEKRTLNNLMKHIVKCMLYKYIQVPFVKSIKCIGIGFPYDAIEIKKWYGDKMIKSAPYDMGYDFNEIKDIKAKSDCKDIKKTMYNVLLGHCGYEYLQHIKNIRKIKSYHSKNIKVFIPLSYGDTAYIDKVVQYANESEIDVEIMSDFLSGEEYVKFLTKIDIAIFDFKHQAALGNIYLLLYLEKKIYLDINGIIFKGLKNEDINVFGTRDIGNLLEKDFLDLDFSKKKGVQVSERIFDTKKMAKDWEDLFEYCSRESE